MRRLDQLLANLGYCSRREAREWIRSGRVTAAGEVEKDFGAKARPADVRLDGEPLDHPAGLLLLVHKPLGLVCSHDEREGPNVYSVSRRAGASATRKSLPSAGSTRTPAGCCC
ncbi:MAG: S4 domain-containing protein [Lacunisphaera sp.]